jgi:hypothetical protein
VGDQYQDGSNRLGKVSHRQKGDTNTHTHTRCTKTIQKESYLHMYTVKSYYFVCLILYFYAYTKAVNEVTIIIAMKSSQVISCISIELQSNVSETVSVSIIMIDVMSGMTVHCTLIPRFMNFRFTNFRYNAPSKCMPVFQLTNIIFATTKDQPLS